MYNASCFKLILLESDSPEYSRILLLGQKEVLTVQESQVVPDGHFIRISELMAGDLGIPGAFE
jgi:hypothetical protein